MSIILYTVFAIRLALCHRPDIAPSRLECRLWRRANRIANTVYSDVIAALTRVYGSLV